MAKIQILPHWEAQKIAAGEVVERPASVVKELIENAIDAGATSIELEITNGGKKQIAIHDNGQGMSREDALLCIENHATSKISSITELSQISTFGFRGEALSSIAAASRLTITTKEASAEHAIQLIFEAGELIEQTAVSRQTGTTIVVEELFFNIPVRKKFLKKDETEWRAIHQLVSALALAHKPITFILKHNNRLVLRAEATDDLHQRFCQVVGMDFHEHIILLKKDSKYAHVHGITSRAPKTRYDKNQIFVFVNQRWVKNYRLALALIKGYDNILLPQHFPIAALFIELDLADVDINVHPRKEEVQFLHPIGVERSIEEAVRNALESEIKSLLHASAQFPTSIVQPNKKQSEYLLSKTYESTATTPPAPSFYKPLQQPTVNTETIATKTTSSFPNREQDFLEEERLETNQNIAIDTPQFTILGQIHLTYIVVQTNEGMLLIDQHAAHERILYEEFKERMNRAEPIDLLFPQIVRLSPDEHAALLPHLSIIEQNGIIIEPFGEQTFSVRAVPTTMKNANIQEFLIEISQFLTDGKIKSNEISTNQIYERMHATMACKAAIKAGDRLTTEAMNKLVQTILITERSTTCPHGRPTTWRVTNSELERKFQRHL